MALNFFIFIASLFFVIKGATLATKYSARLAESFRISKYIIGFIVVAFISILPETLVSINSALRGVPSFGLGTLLGSNVADLTLVFAIIIISVGRGIKIESRVLKNLRLYPFFLLLPLILGFDGYFSQLEGIILIMVGVVFYCAIFKNNQHAQVSRGHKKFEYKNIFFLIVAMIMLLAGSHYTVESALRLASIFSINPILIGMLIVGLGTTMPELFFSLKSAGKKDDGLAVGDILGTVLADATLVVGVIALISPFYFPMKIIYVTGFFMVAAAFILFKFMRSGRVLSKKEGYLLLIFWIIYVMVEFIVNK
ncbi:MAG: K+-dependent Na+/Ca+ exchanger related-protein [Parcubacteria group bacterium GW2011_GWA2_38_13]|nr:MAG: K+-dependent Na+/Ca+ exchanger related-protein [Parcubacteria group bacterium GW2011_GWA2_38_13]